MLYSFFSSLVYIITIQEKFVCAPCQQIYYYRQKHAVDKRDNRETQGGTILQTIPAYKVFTEIPGNFFHQHVLIYIIY